MTSSDQTEVDSYTNEQNLVRLALPLCRKLFRPLVQYLRQSLCLWRIEHFQQRQQCIEGITYSGVLGLERALGHVVLTGAHFVSCSSRQFVCAFRWHQQRLALLLCCDMPGKQREKFVPENKLDALECVCGEPPVAFLPHSMSGLLRMLR